MPSCHPYEVRARGSERSRRVRLGTGPGSLEKGAVLGALADHANMSSCRPRDRAKPLYISNTLSASSITAISLLTAAPLRSAQDPYGFKYDIDKRRRELRGCFEYVFRCPSFLLKAS